MIFPAFSDQEKLSAIDFSRFRLQFTRTVLDFFPCDLVEFIIGAEETVMARSGGVETSLSEMWRAGVSMVRRQGQAVVDEPGGLLFLPIYDSSEPMVVAVLSGGSRSLYGQYGLEWLEERGRFISREFVKIKHWSHDPVSGLLNAAHLGEELELFSLIPRQNEGLGGGGHLFMVEVVTKSHDAAQAMRNIGRIAAYLDSLLGEVAAVHHLGVGVFALIWNSSDPDEIQKLGYAILRKLKRQNVDKVHIGIAPLYVCKSAVGDDESVAGQEVMSRAWEELSRARQRGVFALCATSVGDSRGQNPLVLPPVTIMAQLKRLWRRQNQFSVVIVQRDIELPDKFPGRVLALGGEMKSFMLDDSKEVCFYLPGFDEQAAAAWVAGLQERINGLGCGSFSMGIASYPCPGFNKTDSMLNARKAMLHANFLGPESTISFDGVSLNISGDVYYNEGDLVQAIKEYRLGLNLDPDNVNLLNSLAVIYAQIESYKKAINLFERVLALEPEDFMALFNLGFAHLCRGDSGLALSYFERALEIDDTYFDLLQQLGQLYCKKHMYKKAVMVLMKAVGNENNPTAHEGKAWERCEPWLDVDSELGRGLVYRYLGEAYKGLGKNKEAMTYLQRAARYNSRDAEALSMLGELYAVEKQGLDIALSFCSQAVELDDSKAGHWYSMAFTLFHREELPEAMDTVRRCLKLTPKNIEALMLMAQIDEKLDLQDRARKTYERVLKLDGTNNQAVKALKKINKARG